MPSLGCVVTATANGLKPIRCSFPSRHPETNCVYEQTSELRGAWPSGSSSGPLLWGLICRDAATVLNREETGGALGSGGIMAPSTQIPELKI